MKNQLLENIKESTGKTVNKTLKNEEPIQIAFYPPEAQGTGAFDGGRITEFKPIAFPYEGPTVRHVGPLFYWAWASANGYGKIKIIITDWQYYHMMEVHIHKLHLKILMKKYMKE